MRIAAAATRSTIAEDHETLVVVVVARRHVLEARGAGRQIGQLPIGQVRARRREAWVGWRRGGRPAGGPRRCRARTGRHGPGRRAPRRATPDGRRRRPPQPDGRRRRGPSGRRSARRRARGTRQRSSQGLCEQSHDSSWSAPGRAPEGAQRATGVTKCKRRATSDESAKSLEDARDEAGDARGRCRPAGTPEALC